MCELQTSVYRLRRVLSRLLLLHVMPRDDIPGGLMTTELGLYLFLSDIHQYGFELIETMIDALSSSFLHQRLVRLDRYTTSTSLHSCSLAARYIPSHSHSRYSPLITLGVFFLVSRQPTNFSHSVEQAFNGHRLQWQ